MTDDATLVEQALADDPSAFEQLVRRYQGLGFAAALQTTRNFHDAQDIVQEAFCSALVHLPQLAEPAQFRPWFLRIVANQARMASRKRKRSKAREEAMGLDWYAQPVEYDRFVKWIAWREIIEKALQGLSPSNRSIATLYFFDDHTCREVAEALGLPIGTVKRRLHDIRKVLGKEIRIMVNEQGKLQHHIGTETLGGLFTVFIQKDTSLPTQWKEIFTTAQDRQSELDIHFLEGEAVLASQCRSLARVTLKDFSVAPRGMPEIVVELTVEKDGTLSIEATEKQPVTRQVTVATKTGIERVSVQGDR